MSKIKTLSAYIVGRKKPPIYRIKKRKVISVQSLKFLREKKEK